MPSSDRLVLLFLHGGGFNKETWAPVIRRVQDSTLLKSVPCEIHSMDWPFHGTRSDDSSDAVIWFDGPKKNWPRVDHPAKNWPHWAPEELYKQVQRIREKDQELPRRTRIVVVAHSMGATAAMLVEMQHPGTFDGLVAFEPICNGNMAPEVCVVAANVMVANTLAREGEWSSWEDVLTHFRTNKLYRKWHPEATASYLEGAVRKSPPVQRHGDTTMAYQLAMPPIQEAALYCYDIKAVTFAMEDYARMQCCVVFEYGAKTTLFRHDIMADVADVFPSKFSLSRPIQAAAHLMILENPDACAERIVVDLATFPVFQDAALRKGSKL